MAMARVLVIAGSDSSGGAGLEADQKVIAAHGCYAMTATTALTAQNTRGVRDIHRVPANFVQGQIEAVVEDVGVDVVKTGMLSSAETIEMVARMMGKYSIPNLVLDPVMISTSGATLLPHEAIKTLLTHLLPLTTILTPNIPEARLILQQSGLSTSTSDSTTSDITSEKEPIRSAADLERLGRKIQTLGPKWVLVKGGHLPFRKRDLTVGEENEKEVVVDVLVGPGQGDVFRVMSPWQESSSTHGTGCSLASAIASGLAKKMTMPDAVRAACRYIEAGIRTAPGLGGGHGPLNHFHSTYTLPFSPGYFIEYLLSRPDVKPVWEQYIHHSFVMAMGNGSLPLESFKGYMIQDYLYLIQFARANALAAYKSNNLGDIARSWEIVGNNIAETKLHVKYCETFNISLSEMQATEEHQACTAYTRYVLDIGQSQDQLALQIAMAPCLLGYYAIADMLQKHPDTIREGNAYWEWIEAYVASDYLEAVKIGSELLEKSAVLQSPSRIEELVKIFIHATRMEIGFWEMFPCNSLARYN